MDPASDFLSSTAALVHARGGNAKRAEELALHALGSQSARRLRAPLDALRVLRNAWFRDGRLSCQHLIESLERDTQRFRLTVASEASR